MLPRKSKLLHRIIYILVFIIFLIWYFDIYSVILYDSDRENLVIMDVPELISLYKQLRKEEINITCDTDIQNPSDGFANKLRNCLLIMIRKRFLNPHPFKYIMNPTYVCENGNPYLLIYVHSAPQHQRRRMLIRQTWGQVNDAVRLVFLMGLPQTDDLQRSLVFENDLYGDLVQEDFIDSYRNLTYKAIMGLRWVTVHCRAASYVLKSDDDVFVDVFAVLRHLRHLADSSGVDLAPQENHMGGDRGADLLHAGLGIMGAVHARGGGSRGGDIWRGGGGGAERVAEAAAGTTGGAGRRGVNGLLQCMVWYRMKVMRDRKSKWYVPYSDYSAPYFPTYCSGLAFLASTDVIRRMALASRDIQFFWVDDVFITGSLASFIGVKHRSIGRIRGEAYSLKIREFAAAFANESRRGHLMFGHVHDEQQFLKAWQDLVDYEARRIM